MPTTVPTQYQGNMQQQHQNYQGVGAVGNNAVHGQQQAPGGLLAPQGQPTQAQAALQVHQSHAQTLFARLPQAHVPPGQQQQQQQQQFQRLKVEDALSYLDQVKLQFGNHPHVYNEFLDIMKEFKSQTIDTPGVINRVSNLFKGHSDLIVGFNTFLPPGYKIEVQANEQINVHQPGQAVMALSTVMGMAAAAQNEAKAAAAAAAAPAAAAAAATTGPPASTVNTQNTAMQPATTSGGAAAAYRRDSNRPLWDNFLKALPMPQTASGSVVAPGASHHSYHQPLSGPTPQDANLTSPQQPPQQQPTNQPVEFNHAINYVNKIKNRFQGTPSIYKSFLEILHTYQKEQRNIKEGVGQGGSNKPLSESEVYNQVACLFRSQEDLLSEFGQFLPDANGSGGLFSGQVLGGSAASMSMPESAALGGMRNDHSSTLKKAGMPHKAMGAGSAAARGGHIRRASGSRSLAVQPPPSKKMKTFRDVPYSEAAKAGTLADYAFFDRVRKALKHEEAYKNFIRCLKSYNDDVVSAQQLVSMTEPFLGRFPELQRAFKDLVGLREGGSIESIPATALGKERIGGDYAKEIDFSSCKRLGASYRALPKSFEPPKCSGRTNLCKEVLETLNNTCFVVEESKNGGANFGCSKNIYEEKIFKCEGQRFETLNDVWVSFPSWSEDSNFVTGRKNQFEELIYRTEDERFQLDIVMEINTSAMMSLEVVQKKLQKMSSEEASKYKLDNCLGGTSEYINRKAVERIYGGKAGDIIEGLKKNPVVAVPLVLRRLKAKHDEWKDNQKEFNKQWRDQNEKYYLKSLDHQGLTFKQNDVKQIRSKALLNEIETIFDERQEAAAAAQDTEDGGKDAVAAAATGPHLTLYHRGDPSILEDAAALLVHHVARQSSLHGDDKRKIKQLLHHFLPDLFHVPRGVLSDDEDDTERQAGQSRGDADNSSSIKEEPNDSTTAEESSDAAATTAATPAADATDASDAAAAADKENSKDAPMDVDENSTSNEKEKEKSKSSPGKSSPATTKADVEIKTEDEIKKEPEEQENKDQGRPTAETNGSTIGSESKYSLFFVSNNWYLFLRLHQLLCERLFKMSELAQKIAADEAKCKRERNESTAAALRLKANLEVEPEDYYPYLLERIKELLDGQVEASVYEDILREMYGIHAYTAFTMDKIVQSLVRTLQHLVSDDIDLQATELFLQEKKNGGTGGSIVTAAQRSGAEQAYQRRAEHTMSEENCFKVVLFADDFKLTIELLDTEDQGHSEADAVEQWSSYVENFVNPSTTDLPTPIREAMASKPIFMPRAVRRGAEGKCQPGEEKDKDEASGSGNGEDGTGDEGKRKMEYYDDTECKFNINSYKIVYVIKSESYFYKRCAFARARKRHPALSLIKHNKFWDGFMNQWMEKNLTEEHKEKCDKFFMGEIGDLKKCRTRCYRNNPLHKEPYHLYNRFRVQYLESDDEESQPSPEPMATDSN